MPQDASGKLADLVLSINLIPYFRAHPDYTLMEAAQDLGKRPREIKEALERLLYTGIGKYGGENIELEADYRRPINIINDQGLNKALRLTPIEASALLITLESLESMSGLVDTDAVRSAADKLRRIMDKKTEAMYDSLAQPDPDESEALAHISEAVCDSRVVRFDYWNASKDSTARRTVVPALIFIHDTETYVRAWDEDRQGFRQFRFDRIDNVEVLERIGDPHTKDLDFDPEDPFNYGTAHRARLEIDQSSTWLTYYHDIELGRPLGNGWVEATMSYLDSEWLVRFALAQAGRVRVVGPDSLVEAVAKRARLALERYTL